MNEQMKNETHAESYGDGQVVWRTHDIPRGSLVPIRTDFAKFWSKCLVPIRTKWDQNASEAKSTIRTEMPDTSGTQLF